MAVNSGQPLDESINVEDNETVIIPDEVIAPLGEPAVTITGEDGTLIVTDEGSISAVDEGNTAVQSSGGDALIANLGDISGDFNGISSSGDDLALINTGVIESNSRAIDLTDGDNLLVINAGEIVGTDDQRNGTVYIDGTVDDTTISNLNGGVIDAGEHNSGSGISVQVGATGDEQNENINIINDGVIQGRGTDNVPAGVRLFVGSGLEEATFVGDITNQSNGLIASEESAGILIEEGVIFDGTIINDGTIASGNGVAIDAAGALGDIEVLNSGELDGEVLLGQGNDTFVQNSDEAASRIDGGEGIDTIDLSGQSAGIVIDLDLNTPTPGPATQDGAILDAPGGEVITEIDNFENVIGTDFDDLILGNNEINILEGGAGNDAIHSFAGADILDGGTGIDTALFTAGGGVVVDLDEEGNAISSFGDQLISFENINGSAAGDDVISGNSSVNVLNGQGGNDILDGEGGADTLLGGAGDDVFIGGLGNDTLNGGEGSDTADFSDIDVPVTVTLDADGNGTATRETGFFIDFAEVAVESLNTDAIANDGAFLAEALAGNLYFNVHTNDFNGGEIRGQLDTIVSDNEVNGIRTIVLSGLLDASQEPGPTSDSEATGEGTITLVVDADGEITYSLDLAISGLATSDLLPVAGFSAIHLHNAPAGVNGPVILDVVQDAGGDITGAVVDLEAETGDGNIFNEVIETDTLISIENIIGSNDSDTITGNDKANVLIGNEGDDSLVGAGGADTLLGGAGDDIIISDGLDTVDGGEGIDTIDLSGLAQGVVIDLDLNTPTPGPATQDGAILDAPGGNIVVEIDDVENVIGTDFDDLILGNNEINILEGGAGNDAIHSFAGADILDGGTGIDTALFTAGGGVIVDLDENGDAISSFGDQLISFENINGSAAGDDTISGNSSANVLNGQGGNDILDGEGGADTLLGGAGNDIIISDGLDTVDGGEGIDTINLSGLVQGVVIDLDLNTPTPGPATQDGAILDAPGGDVVVEIDDVENVIGTDFDDLILGNNEINILEGGAGNDAIHSFAGADILDGGTGIDTALFTAGGGVIVDLDENGDAISSFGDQLISFENINGSAAGDDTISGNSSANVLNGQGGNDILNGEGGIDTLLGGDGNDVLVGGAGVLDFLTGGAGFDTFDFTVDTGASVGLSLDIVTDFSVTDDLLNVSAFFSDVDVALGAASQIGSATLLSFGGGNFAALLDTNADTLIADNFIVAEPIV